MKINDIIRARRQDMGLTQEGLAAKLGVSAPAVNKWERGLNYPDITLLPALARALRVDLNTLLSFQDDITEQEIGLFLGKVYEAAGTEGIEAGFELAREKLREFPNSDLLAYSLAGLLEGLLVLAPGEQENEAREREIEELYRRSADSSDPRVREWACCTLAGRCTGRGELEQAQTFLDQLSDSHQDKQTLTAALRRKEGRREEAWEILERDLLNRAHAIQTTLLHLMDLALEEQDNSRARLFADTAARAGEIFELLDYATLSAPLQLAMAQRDGPRALELLDRMLLSLTTPWHTEDSNLYCHLPVKEGGQIDLIPAILEEIQRDPDSAFLRELDEYQTLLEKYQ